MRILPKLILSPAILSRKKHWQEHSQYTQTHNKRWNLQVLLLIQSKLIGISVTSKLESNSITVFEAKINRLIWLYLNWGVLITIDAWQECQWSGQKFFGSAECVWLSLKFTHYQIFYQRLILFNVPEVRQTSPGIWCFPQGCAPIERLLMQLLTFFWKHRDRWSRDHDCKRLKDLRYQTTFAW